MVGSTLAAIDVGENKVAVTKSDMIIFLAQKAGMKLLSIPLGKASAYYKTHIDVLTKAVEAMQKGKKIEAQVDDLIKKVSDQKRVIAELTKHIQRNPILPDKDAKAWGKNKKIKTYKEALEGFRNGASAAVQTLKTVRLDAEKTLKEIPALEKKLFDASNAGKSKKGDLDTITNATSGHAFMKLSSYKNDMNRTTSTVISDLKKREAAYRKVMTKAGVISRSLK
ncbi:hypothetical protein [Tateyamaria sp.]|uniref:hypothetical protein n=1 Tax=Tateyamaria sp. TaxID=1929288 RepID=UPI00329F2719